MNIAITGASRGIGKAIALEFGKTGFNKFYLTCKKDLDLLLDVQDELENNNNEVVVREVDVSNRNQVYRESIMLEAIHPDFKIDALINNAGILKDRTLIKMSEREWDDVINTNLTGVFNFTKAFLPLMNSGGSIINMGSIVGLTGNFGQTNYSASKAGLIAFTKSLSMELANKNIRVNMVSPSLVNTDMIKHIPKEQYDKLIERTTLKRVATPEEIAKFVAFLCKDGTYCTGQNYVIDGGFK